MPAQQESPLKVEFFAVLGIPANNYLIHDIKTGLKVYIVVGRFIKLKIIIPDMLKLNAVTFLAVSFLVIGCSSQLSESDAKELALQEVSNFFDSQSSVLSESELEKAKNNLSVTYAKNLNGTWHVVVYSSDFGITLRVLVTSREEVKIPGLTGRELEKAEEPAERCILPTIIDCAGQVVSKDSISLNLKNNAGRSMVISGVNFHSQYVMEGCRAEVNKVVADSELAEIK